MIGLVWFDWIARKGMIVVCLVGCLCLDWCEGIGGLELSKVSTSTV